MKCRAISKFSFSGSYRVATSGRDRCFLQSRGRVRGENSRRLSLSKLSPHSLPQVKKNVKAYKMTSMREPVSIFEEFLSGLASERKGELIAQSDAKMEI